MESPKTIGPYKTTEFVKSPSSNGKHLVILSYVTLWELHLHIYLVGNMHGCLPSMQNHYELQEAVREDFSMELRRKGISKYLPILLNGSHPLESGWWISGHETCCGFLELIHKNAFFFSFIHLISCCVYLHTLFFHAANFLPSLLLPLNASGAATEEHTRLCMETPIWKPKDPPQVYCSFLHSNSSWRPKSV